MRMIKEINRTYIKSLVTFLAAISFFSCSSQINEESLVGTWKVIDFESNADLSPILIASAKEYALTNVYSFEADHTVWLKDAYGPNGYKGSWDLDSEQKLLKLSFESPTGTSTTEYRISEFNDEEIVWIEDMQELGENRFTLSRCDDCNFEIPTVDGEQEIEMKKLDDLSNTSTKLTDTYCDCMIEMEDREDCVEEYDSARFEIKTLSDLAKKRFNIENEHAPSNNKYIVLVKELRERLVDCRNGMKENEFIYDKPPSK